LIIRGWTFEKSTVKNPMKVTEGSSGRKLPLIEKSSILLESFTIDMTGKWIRFSAAFKLSQQIRGPASSKKTGLPDFPRTIRK